MKLIDEELLIRKEKDRIINVILNLLYAMKPANEVNGIIEDFEKGIDKIVKEEVKPRKKREKLKRDYDIFKVRKSYMKIEDLLVKLKFFDERYKYIPKHGHKKLLAMIIRVLHDEGFCKRNTGYAGLNRHLTVHHDCPELNEELYRKEPVFESEVRMKLELPQNQKSGKPRL